MKSFKIILIVSSICVALTGCNSPDSAANSPDSSSKEGASPVAVAEKAKCGGCGNDVPKAELVSHDGKMMCKACMDAHGH